MINPEQRDNYTADRECDPEVEAWIESWDNLDDYDDSEHATYDPVNGKQLITFLLGEETYCINIQHASEIVDEIPIRTIPNTSSHLKGVISLRRSIIPVHWCPNVEEVKLT